MKIVFTKNQLALIREENLNQNKAPKTVLNSEGDSDTSSLQKDLSKVNQSNSDHSDIVIPTSQFTNKTIPPQNKGVVTTIPNNTDAAAQATKMINSTNPNDMPSMIRLQNNGVERYGNLIEVTTFTKKELTEFLNSL